MENERERREAIDRVKLVLKQLDSLEEELENLTEEERADVDRGIKERESFNLSMRSLNASKDLGILKEEDLNSFKKTLDGLNEEDKENVLAHTKAIYQLLRKNLKGE